VSPEVSAGLPTVNVLHLSRQSCRVAYWALPALQLASSWLQYWLQSALAPESPPASPELDPELDELEPPDEDPPDEDPPDEDPPDEDDDDDELPSVPASVFGAGAGSLELHARKVPTTRMEKEVVKRRVFRMHGA